MFDIDLDEDMIVLVCAVVGVIVILLIIYRLGNYSIRYRFVPIDLTIEHHIVRIPVEDRIDLEMEDKHNVHNICLKRSAVQVIDKLKQSDRHVYSIEQAIEQIYEMIELNPDTNLDQLDDATAALTAICSINAYYHSGNIAEKDLLRLIWDRINHPLNSQIASQLKDNLIEQLADCRNGYSGVHCCEGRVMRLLQTLEHYDRVESVSLRPMWAYKEEISNKIGVYRQKLLDRAPPAYKELETKIELTEHDRQLLEVFNHCLINNLDKRFTIDYVSKGLLTKNELTDLTDEYYQSLKI